MATTILRDYQHGARLFTDGTFRLLPKTKYLFHVSFSLNENANKRFNTDLPTHATEINMLVKSVDLPRFTVQTEVLNQYNRQKVVQYRHKLDEMGIDFHDDNDNIINKLWQNYYKYYYDDAVSSSKTGAYTRNAMQNFSSIKGSYGLTGVKENFFKYIKVYQMSQKRYASYKLINPTITHWNHNKLSYKEGDPNDFHMKLLCESVEYGFGNVSSTEPEGFGQILYDKTPSPLLTNGTTNSSTLITPTDATLEAALTTLRQLSSYNSSTNTTTTIGQSLGALSSNNTSSTGTYFPGVTMQQTTQATSTNLKG